MSLRTQGFFADDNRDLYGRAVRPRDVLINATIKAPAISTPFMDALRLGDEAER